MRTGMVRCSALVAALLGCNHSNEDRVERVAPSRYRGSPLPSLVLEEGSAAGGLVGAIYDCDGDPITALQLNARRVTPDTSGTSDTLVQMVDSSFTLSSLAPGRWQFQFRSIGYVTRQVSVAIEPGRVDTLMVQMSDSPILPIRDCVCANGRDFGSQCCKPVTVHVCTPRESPMEGQ